MDEQLEARAAELRSCRKYAYERAGVGPDASPHMLAAAARRLASVGSGTSAQAYSGVPTRKHEDGTNVMREAEVVAWLNARAVEQDEGWAADVQQGVPATPKPRNWYADAAALLATDRAAGVGELPEVLPGHWTTPGGRDMALATLDDPHMARSRERISDFALANEVFLSPGIANLTDAKERIRWLSARLALAAYPPAPADASGEADDDEPAEWAIEAERAATEAYASYMGDPDGEDTHTARMAAAREIERHARAALSTAGAAS